MGQKTHPYGFRLGVIKGWRSNWFAEKDFAEWSVRTSDAESFAQSNPVKFKTLNLTKIIKILNAVSNDTFEKTLVATFAMDFNLLK